VIGEFLERNIMNNQMESPQAETNLDNKLANMMKQESPRKLRIFTKLTNHQVNPVNDLIEIITADEPGPGGANHQYLMYWPSQGSGIDTRRIDFQKGAINENGINGLTQEVLLAIVEHRLTSFQAGPFANDFNAQALEHVQEALKILKARTLERMFRGVEGQTKA
jgi:hypothetical protein